MATADRLHRQHKLRVDLSGLQYLEVRRAEHHLGNAGSVRDVGDLTVIAAI